MTAIRGKNRPPTLDWNSVCSPWRTPPKSAQCKLSARQSEQHQTEARSLTLSSRLAVFMANSLLPYRPRSSFDSLNRMLWCRNFRPPAPPARFTSWIVLVVLRSRGRAAVLLTLTSSIPLAALSHLASSDTKTRAILVASSANASSRSHKLSQRRTTEAKSGGSY